MHIIAPHLSCVVNAPMGENAVGSDFDVAVSQGYSEIYVVGPSGIVKYHKLRGEGRYVTIKVDKLPGNIAVHELSEDFSSFLPAGPVPNRLLRQVEAFFRQVMSAHNDALEAMIWIMYNPTQGYYLHVPEQRISKAAVSYDWDSVPSGSSIVVDIHSHNTMGAFFSGTDNGDDRNAIRFSGVFGNLDRATPATVWRFNYMDKKFEASIEDIFEAPPQEEVSVPQEWLSQVKVSSPALAYKGRPTVYRGRSVNEYPYTQPLVGYADIEEVNPHELGKQSKSTRRGKQGKEVGQVAADRHDFWGFGGNGDDIGAMVQQQQMELYGNSAADQAERRMAWEAMVNEADSHVDDLVREVRMENLGEEVEDPVGSYGLYEDLASRFGARVADAYWDIEHEMVDLQGQDELLGVLASDMIGLIDDDVVKLDLLRSAYNSLGSESREKLATNGF